MKRLAGALLVVAVAVGTPAVSAAATKQASSPTVGSTIKTRRVAVTLGAYHQPVALDRPTETTAVGTETAAINVKVCTRTTSTQTVGPYQFFLEGPDRALIFPAKTIGTPQPQLRATPLTSRDCAHGWISYEVPTGIRTAFVVFQAGAMFTRTLHKWIVPKG